MSATHNDGIPYATHIDRRALLRRLARLSVAVAATGCTPVRYALHLYPDTFDDSDAGDRTLAAFARTVIPGLPEHALTFRALKDDRLPFHRFAGFFAADLNRRARRTFGQDFVALLPEQRTTVVADGLNDGGTTTQLYGGAIFLTQISCYAGIYDAAGGCPLIAFYGAGGFRGLDATTFPDPDRFLATSVTHDGNPT